MTTDSCRTCGAEIIWLENARTGKPMLFDAEATPDPEEPDQRTQLWIFVGETARRAHRGDTGPFYTVHWGTCPDAKEWKGRSREKMRELDQIDRERP